jgi:hypothetical protein
LAPDIQEMALTSQAVNGSEPLRERDLRAVSGTADWNAQRQYLATLQENGR